MFVFFFLCRTSWQTILRLVGFLLNILFPNFIRLSKHALFSRVHYSQKKNRNMSSPFLQLCWKLPPFLRKFLFAQSYLDVFSLYGNGFQIYLLVLNQYILAVWIRSDCMHRHKQLVNWNSLWDENLYFCSVCNLSQAHFYFLLNSWKPLPETWV